MKPSINKINKRVLRDNWRYFKKHSGVYAFLIPGIVLCAVFQYLPYMGIKVAFLDYDVFKGLDSPFAGLENFKTIFTMPAFTTSILNTLRISVLNIIIVFPLPIVFALLLNEVKNGFFKRFTQTVSYLPHFLSTIAVIGMATSLFSNYGIINDIRIAIMGADTPRELFLTRQSLFLPMVIGLEIWKGLGWSAIIYLATISGIDPALYEAAIIDGAKKFRQCIHITLPALVNTVVILLILKIGSLFASNFDLIYGLQNVYIDYEVISTIVYKQGIEQGAYGVSTALGFAQGVISLILVLFSNWFAKKFSGASFI